MEVKVPPTSDIFQPISPTALNKKTISGIVAGIKPRNGNAGT